MSTDKDKDTHHLEWLSSRCKKGKPRKKKTKKKEIKHLSKRFYNCCFICSFSIIYMFFKALDDEYRLVGTYILTLSIWFDLVLWYQPPLSPTHPCTEANAHKIQDSHMKICNYAFSAIAQLFVKKNQYGCCHGKNVNKHGPMEK